MAEVEDRIDQHVAIVTRKREASEVISAKPNIGYSTAGNRKLGI